MTIKEKREKLEKFCMSLDNCAGCPLLPWPEAGCVFVEESDCKWTDDRIREAYDAVFNPKPTNSAVDHPKHYNREGAMECIDEMVLIFGKEETMVFCKLNAWKYRYRAADKGAEEDLKKSDWYLAEYRRLRDE
jgi:hypothetical protein